MLTAGVMSNDDISESDIPEQAVEVNTDDSDMGADDISWNEEEQNEVLICT